MAALAKKVVAVSKEGDRDKYLDNLFRLQIVAGQHGDALNIMASSWLRCAGCCRRATQSEPRG